jgi:hypothetical protein
VASHQHSDYPQHSGQQHSGYQQRSEPVEAARPAAFGSGSFGSVTLQSMQHSFAPGPNSFGPGPNSVAPVTASYAPHLAQSTGPVALEVDEDMPAMHHGRRFRPERWALAAAALVAVGVVGYNNMFSSSVASAGTQAPASTALAARPYDGAEPGEKLNAKAAATEESSSKAAHEPSIAPAAAPAAVAVPSTKAAALTAKDDAEPESGLGSSRSKGSDKEGLKGSFSKAFNKKATAAKPAKVKPRKATSRATKSRATRSSKKPGVARSQSAFDPLNDSLP